MKKYIFFSAIMSLCFTSCLNDLDNYDAPDGGIQGKILDMETNMPIPLPVQGSTGVIINMIELNTGATQSVDFYAKMDGTFMHTKLFNCDYKIVVKGPFVNPCEEIITVNGQTTFDLKAMPYARIEAQAVASGRKVTVNYKVSPTQSSYAVSDVYGYWNFVPGIDNGSANQAGKQSQKEVEGAFVFDLENDEAFKNNRYKIQSNGNKIYVRVGANINGVINYSQIIQVTIQ